MKKQNTTHTRHHRSFSWGDESQFLMETLHSTPQETVVLARRQPGVQIVGADPLIQGSAIAIESARKTVEWALSGIEDGSRVEFIAHRKQCSDIVGGVALTRYEVDDDPTRVALSYWRTSGLDVRTTADMCQAAALSAAQTTEFGHNIVEAELRISVNDQIAQRVAVELGARTTGQMFFDGAFIQSNPAAATYNKWQLKMGEA